MALTFGEVPLLQIDSGGQFQRWLNQFQRIEETPWFGCQTPIRKTLRNITRTNVNSMGLVLGQGLPLPNYFCGIRPRFNQLYWPGAGASRFAVGFFLVDNDSLQNIYELIGEDNDPADLIIGDVTYSDMTLLPPRKINATSDPCLWALCLVDQRYIWQFHSTDSLTISSSSTWANIYDDIQTQLGITIEDDTVASGYLSPDWIELQRQYETIPVLLDAVAASCGQRITVDFDNTVSAFNSNNGDPTQSNVLEAEDEWTLAAGGDNRGLPYELPQNLIVTFPKITNFALYGAGDLYHIQKSLDGTFDGELIVHSSCFADFTMGSMSADNQTNLDNLASAIAETIKNWHEYRFDYTFNCVKDWTFTGFEDYYCVWYGAQIKDGLPLAQTRVVSMPYDFWTDQQLQQDPALMLLPNPCLGKLHSTITQGNSGQIDIGDVSGALSPAVKIIAWDWMKTDNTYPSGIRVMCFFCGQPSNNKWYFIPVEDNALFISGSLTASLSSGSNVTCTVTSAHNGLNPGSTVTVYDEDGAFGPYPITTNPKYRAFWAKDVNKYIFLWIGC